MLCEVMPTISEDTAAGQRGSQSSASDPDSHFEQLMVNMLDERDRLLDTLRETQESLGLAQQHLQDVIYDRDSLQRQLSSALPQVNHPDLLWNTEVSTVLSRYTRLTNPKGQHVHIRRMHSSYEEDSRWSNVSGIVNDGFANHIYLS
nr:liprin-alpha-2-like [Paramormyrops kingsleyae]